LVDLTNCFVTGCRKIFFSGVLFILYFINKLLVERFLIKKIRVLYKTIQSIQSQREEDSNTSEDILESAQENVLMFAKSQEETINSLKKMEQYRRDFLGNVSHELKTPLTAIKGYTETLIGGALRDEKNANN